MGFSSPGGDSAPIKVTFGTGDRTVKVHLYRDRNVGIVPKTVKIWNFDHKIAPEGRLVCRILRNFQRLYASIRSF